MAEIGGTGFAGQSSREQDQLMRVTILAPPGVQSLDVVGPAEVFWEAARRLGDPKAYEVQVMSTSAEPVCGTGGLRFLADRNIFEPDEPIDRFWSAEIRRLRRSIRQW